MAARSKPDAAKDSTATIGFEATGPRSSALTMGGATYRSPKGSRWLTAEQAVPAPHFAEAEYNSARTEGLLGLSFLSRAERDRLPKAARRASAGPRVQYISDTFKEHRAKLLAG